MLFVDLNLVINELIHRIHFSFYPNLELIFRDAFSTLHVFHLCVACHFPKVSNSVGNA